jgi:outer membrane lipoprotein-sorting protein
MKKLLLGLCFLGCAALRAETVDDVLARMDREAPNFHAISADVKMVEFTSVLNDTTTEAGTLQMQRRKPGEVRAIINFPASREIAFFGKKLIVYYPKLKTYQEFDLGKDSNVLNEYLLLGFGSSGKELAQSYTITSQGSEKVAEKDTTKLLLLPKDRTVQQRLQKIEMWVPVDAAYPVQQQFYEPSGNYRKVTYSAIIVNPPIPGNLELKLPSGTKRQSP